MIRDAQPTDLECTTTEDHVRTVAEEIGVEPIPAGEWLFCIRRVPLLGAPIIYRARVSS